MGYVGGGVWYGKVTSVYMNGGSTSKMNWWWENRLVLISMFLIWIVIKLFSYLSWGTGEAKFRNPNSLGRRCLPGPQKDQLGNVSGTNKMQ
jgi:hypothetical protein